jgi:rRNA biogenesis protein RRP5
MQATVRNVLSDGLLVSFLKYFHGTVDAFHLPQDLTGTWRTALPPGTRMPARILHVDPSTKHIRLSLLKNLVAFHLSETLPVLGEVYKDARVIRADKSMGLLLALPREAGNLLGYVHISNVADQDTAGNIGKSVPPGSKVSAKVIGYRMMDALATASMKESDLQQGADISWTTLKPGSILDGTVHSVEDYGILVQLGKAVRGLVPLMHVSEAATPKKLQPRFKAGQKIKVR